MNQKILGLVVALVIVVSILSIALAQSIIQSNVDHVSFPYKLSLTHRITLNLPCRVELQAILSMDDMPIQKALIRFYICNSDGSNQTAIGAYTTNSNGLAMMEYYTIESDLYFKATWTIGE